VPAMAWRWVWTMVVAWGVEWAMRLVAPMGRVWARPKERLKVRPRAHPKVYRLVDPMEPWLVSGSVSLSVSM
jgi:hypothetical protein